MIACVDFNGVLDAYTGWQGPAHFEPPRTGAREFLDALAARGFEIVVFSPSAIPTMCGGGCGSTASPTAWPR